MKLHDLHIYPIKSCRGVDLTQANILPRGLEFDRRWMIVNAQGQFISQRSHSKLAQMIVAADNDGLDIKLNGQIIRAEFPRTPRIDVRVWKSTLNAPIADMSINEALSEWLGEAVRLVYMDPQTVRPTSSDWAAGHETSFSDGYPILVTNTASLKVLNQYIHKVGYDDVTMARFRPNIVINCDQAWAEDDWTTLKIGDDVILDLVKPCTRCIVTTLDPMTGEAHPEPVMGALRALRMSPDPRIKGVLFGVNAVVRHGGIVKRGMAVHAI